MHIFFRKLKGEHVIPSAEGLHIGTWCGGKEMEEVYKLCDLPSCIAYSYQSKSIPLNM